MVYVQRSFLGGFLVFKANKLNVLYHQEASFASLGNLVANHHVCVRCFLQGMTLSGSVFAS